MVDPLSKYNSCLDKSFHSNKKIKLEKIIEPSKRGTTIPKGTLVLMPFVNGQLRIKILEKNTPDKGFSIPLKLIKKDEGLHLTADYLAWFLKHDFVKDRIFSPHFSQPKLFIIWATFYCGSTELAPYFHENKFGTLVSSCDLLHRIS